MTVIADKDRATIHDLLSRELDAPVELLLFTRPRANLFVPGRQDCQTCAETRELLEELTGLADVKFTLTVHDVAADPATAARYNVWDVPTVVVRRAAATATGDALNGAESPRTGEEDEAHQSSKAAGAPTATDAELDSAMVIDDGAPGPDEAPANVRFVGLPGGYEFSTLVADVVDVSKGRNDLSEATRAAVRAIDEPVHLQVFVTPT